MAIQNARRIYQLHAHEFPVDPEKIAERLGVKVIKTTWKFSDTPNTSGRAAIENGEYVIEVDTLDAPVRQRFTIAHELAHHVLGHTKNGQKFRDTPDNFRMNSSPLEVEANVFAAELLMPEVAMRMAVFERGIKSVPELAKMFDVSQVAMSIRLKNIGMIHEQC